MGGLVGAFGPTLGGRVAGRGREPPSPFPGAGRIDEMALQLTTAFAILAPPADGLQVQSDEVSAGPES